MRVRITWVEAHEWSLDVKDAKEAQSHTDALDVPKGTQTCVNVTNTKWERNM